MPQLTDAAVKKYVALPKKRREIRDTGGTALYLIIQPKPKGTKGWAMRFRRPDGRPAKLTIGSVELSDKEPKDEPEFGGALTLRQARQLSAQIDRERARGTDVVEYYKADKHRKAAAAATSAANTFAAAAREFFVDHRTRRNERPRRWRDDARLVGLSWPRGADPATDEPTILPGSLVVTWRDRAVSEIDGHDIHTIVDGARRHGIPGLPRHNKDVSAARGRKMHAVLSNLFRWLLQSRRVATNPAIGVWHPGAGPSRVRVLSDEEIAAFWKATAKLRQPYGAAARTLLLTGARLNEVMGMRRGELSADGATWTIPGTRTKNHRDHTVPLPPLARDIIAAVPALDADFVFSTGRGPATGWSRAKAELDAAMPAATPNWRLHDLRRTCASGMQKLGIRVEVIERSLNHLSGSFGGVVGIYQRDPMTDEVRAALERWATHIAGLVAGKPANVDTTLERRRRRR
jgi:integrase